MKKNSHENDASSSSHKPEKLAFIPLPLELQPINEFITQSKIIMTRLQMHTDYRYFRDLGTNVYQALSYLYIEEILRNATVTFTFNWLEVLRSEESNIFHNKYFQSKMPKKFLDPQVQEAYIKSEAVFFDVFEKYLDFLLSNERQDRTHLGYDFYFQCLGSESLRLFCVILLRKMVSYFYYNLTDTFKKVASDSQKIWDLDEIGFSYGDLKLISTAINFRIDFYQASRDIEMKQELVQVVRSIQPNGRLMIVIFENKYYCFYGKNEKIELHNEMHRKYENIKKENVKKKNPEAIEVEEKHDNREMEIELEKDNNANEKNNNEIFKDLKKEAILIPSDEEDVDKKSPFKENLLEKLREEEEKEKQDSPKERKYSIDLNDDAKPKLKKSAEIPQTTQIYKERCVKCGKSGHSKPLFSVQRCHHLICFDCMVSKFYDPAYLKERNGCPTYNCLNVFYLRQIEEYCQEIQINESKAEAMNIEEEQDKNQQKAESNQKSEKAIISNVESDPKIESNNKIKINQKVEGFNKIDELKKVMNQKMEGIQKLVENQKKEKIFENEDQQNVNLDQFRQKIVIDFRNSNKIDEEKNHNADKIYDNPAQRMKLERSMDKENSNHKAEKSAEKDLLPEKMQIENSVDKKFEKSSAKHDRIEEEERSYKRDEKYAKEKERDLIMGTLSDKKDLLRSPPKALGPSDKPEANGDKDVMILEDSDKEQPKFTVEPKIICVFCQKSSPQSQIFSNPSCFHCYCYQCIIKIMSINKDYMSCQAKNCFQLLKKISLEKYIEDRNRSEAENDPEKSRAVKQICYCCQKESQVFINQNTEMNFFQCRLCKKSSCLIHKAPLADCFCFCDHCSIKTESDLMRFTRKICINCRQKYCLLCKQSKPGLTCSCYCRNCDEVIYEEKEEKKNREEKSLLCKNCENNCENCKQSVRFEKLIAGEKCGCLFCRECMFSGINYYRKYKCIFKHY